MLSSVYGQKGSSDDLFTGDKDITFCNDQPSDGIWVAKGEEETTVIEMGVPCRVVPQIPLRHCGREVTRKINAFRHATDLASPSLRMRSGNSA